MHARSKQQPVRASKRLSTTLPYQRAREVCCPRSRLLEALENRILLANMPLAQVDPGFKIGNILADPVRNTVYVLDQTNNRVVAIDTDLGRQSDVASTVSAPGGLAISTDASELYVTCPGSNLIEVYSLSNHLALARTLSINHPSLIAAGAGDRLYISGSPTWGAIRELDANTGALVASFGSYYLPLPVVNAAGTTLYISELGLSTTATQAYDVSNPSVTPTIFATYATQMANGRDFAVDDLYNRIYPMSGGVYGVYAVDIATKTGQKWSGAGYGESVGVNAAGPYVYAGFSGGIVYYDRSNGAQLGLYDTPDPFNDIVDLAVTPNGHVVYVAGQGTWTTDARRLGIVGLSSLTVTKAPPPTINVSHAASTTEGSPYSITFSAVDHTAGATLTQWKIAWGDGTTSLLPGSATSASHTFTDGPATPQVSLTVTDSIGDFQSSTFVLNVNNAPPAITLITGSTTPPRNQTTSLAVYVSDAGTVDTESFDIDWGDGTAHAVLTATSPNIRSFSANHTYTSAGTFTQRVLVSDKDGGQDSQVRNVVVSKATPVIAWSTPAPITYGTALSPTQLNATAGIPGTFSYSPVLGTILPAGNRTLSVTFTPTDTANYSSASATVNLAVNKANPVLTWPAPVPIAFGTPLSATQLNASTNLPAGVFSYSPSAGTVLSPGSYNLSVSYTPNDINNYNIVNKSVPLTVNKNLPVTTLTSSSNPATIGQSVTFTATVTSALASPTGAVQFSIDGATLGPAVPLSSGTATSIAIANLAAGDHSVHAMYLGDANFLSREALITQTIAAVNAPPIPTVFPPNGFVDIANTIKIAGWALDQDALNTPLTIRIDIDGSTAGTTTASLFRADLQARYGSTNHGFSFTMPQLSPNLHRIDVYAIDPANGSPKLIASRMLNTNRLATGWIDVATPAVVKGWAFDPDAGPTPIPLRYSIDANAPEITAAGVTRNDLTASLGSPDHGFTIPLPALTAGRHTVTIWAVDTTSQALTSLGTRILNVTSPLGNTLPRGGLNRISPTVVTGWAQDPSVPAASINVRIDVDGVPGTPFAANLNRPDLLKPLGSARHGFSKPLSLTPGAHKIAVYALDTTTGAAVLIKSQYVNHPAAQGVIDSLTASALQGWARLPGLLTAPVAARVDIDNIPGLANVITVARPDLTPLFGSPNFGYKIALPKLLPGKHTAKFYLIDPLTLTPFLIGARSFTS